MAYLRSQHVKKAQIVHEETANGALAGIANTDISLVASFPGLTFANDVRISGNYAYIADFLSSTADLSILNISASTTPTLFGQANGLGNLSDVDISAGFLYATDGRSGLRIIDVSRPSAPRLRGTYVSGGDASDVKVAGDLAYLADGNVQIIDISNAEAPVLLGSAGIAAGLTGVVTAVDVAGNLAVAASKGIGTGRLTTLNVSNPKAPKKLGEISFALEGTANAVQIVGNTAYLAASNRGLKIFDISNPAMPGLKGEYAYKSSGEAYDVQVVENYAFVAFGLYGLEVIDIRNPSAPTLAASYKPSTRYFGMSVTNTTNSVEVVGNLAYLTVRASKDLGGLWIVDVSPFTAPTPSPTVTLSLAAATVPEDSPANLIFTFSRSGSTSNALTVNYSVAGTARLAATSADPADYRFVGSTSTAATIRSITFAAGSATATATVDPTADSRRESNETVSLQLTAGSGYTIGTPAAVTGTIFNDDIIGTAANDNLIGTALDEYLFGAGGRDSLQGAAGRDRLDGGSGSDILTGGPDADTFVFRFQQSLLAAPDRLTDFTIGTDKIDLLSVSSGTDLPAPSAFSRANNNTATTLATLVAAVFTDANGAIAGNQALATNNAALVVASARAIAGTYLVINDAVAGFQASNDLVVNLTGLTGPVPAPGSIPVSSWFA